jgi:NDP-hexose-3-ketoreductase
MKVLILGYSSIVRRRVLPALLSVKGVKSISIASRRVLSNEVIPSEKFGRVYLGYESALKEADADIVYVSLPNSQHFRWIMASLQAGRHVIVDKPAVISAAQAQEVCHYARSKGLCVTEATVWLYHPVFKMILSKIGEFGGPPTLVSAFFASPKPQSSTIHYDVGLGGGVLLDRGPYAVSAARVFFGNTPNPAFCHRTFDAGVDISCGLLLGYGTRSLFTSYLSLSGEYRNVLVVAGDDWRLEADRIFTMPADFPGAVRLYRQNCAEVLSLPPADSFALFLQDVIASVVSGHHSRFSDWLLQDANLLSVLAAAEAI